MCGAGCSIPVNITWCQAALSPPFFYDSQLYFPARSMRLITLASAVIARANNGVSSRHRKRELAAFRLASATAATLRQPSPQAPPTFTIGLGGRHLSTMSVPIAATRDRSSFQSVSRSVLPLCSVFPCHVAGRHSFIFFLVWPKLSFRHLAFILLCLSQLLVQDVRGQSESQMTNS